MEKSSYANPICRPPPILTEISTQIVPRKMSDLHIDSLKQDISLDFEENSPYQEGVISEIYQRPEKSYFEEPPALQSQVDMSNLVQILLPKQADLDKILNIVQRKVLK